MRAFHSDDSFPETHRDTLYDFNRFTSYTRHVSSPLRSIGYYQIYARTSPPTFCLRACESVMTPFDVETMATPMPPITRGRASIPRYCLIPGRLTRRRPMMTGLPLLYFRLILRNPCFPSSMSATLEMNFWSSRICAIAFFSFDAGISTRRCFALTAFLIRVRKSEIGSVTIETLLKKKMNLIATSWLSSIPAPFLQEPGCGDICGRSRIYDSTRGAYRRYCTDDAGGPCISAFSSP